MAFISSARNSYLAWSKSTPLPISDLWDAPLKFQNWHLHEAESGWTTTQTQIPPTSTSSLSTTLKLATWNVDAFGTDPEARLSGIFTVLETLDEGIPDVIFLQEVSLKALKFLLSNLWIVEWYISSEADESNWSGVQFASLTLLSKARFSPTESSDAANDAVAMSLGPVWRVQYPSRFARDALCCDVFVGGSRVRLVNVHLDSLNINPSNRPRQLAIAASLLKVPLVRFGVVAGDFNPVAQADTFLVAELGLMDAWEVLHPGEDGFTWGLNGEGAPFPPGRLDKVVFHGQGLSPVIIQVLPAPTVHEDIEGSEGSEGPEPEVRVSRCSDHHGITCLLRLDY